MIVIKTTRNAFLFCHFPEENVPGQVVAFEKQYLLSEHPVGAELSSILGENMESCVLLTVQQNKMLSEIFRKLKEEKGSGYVFSHGLQQVYVKELLHFITRVYEEGAWFSRFSLN